MNFDELLEACLGVYFSTMENSVTVVFWDTEWDSVKSVK